MTTVVSILWGRKYPQTYGRILRQMVRKHLAVPHRFLLLVDRQNRGTLDAAEEVLLPDFALEGWWTKIWIFSPEFSAIVGEGARIVWLDLDTVLTGNIDFLADYSGRFAALHDFCNRRLPGTKTPSRGTGIMLFPAGAHPQVWERFDWPASTRGLHGDQEWINENVEGIDVLQRLFPGRICSFKMHCRQPHRQPPAGARVVCFHGVPNPHDLKGQCLEWLETNWTERQGAAAV